MSDTIETSIAPLAKMAELTTADAEFGQIIKSIGLCDEVIRRAKEIKSEIEDIAIKKLRAIGPQRIGTIRWWAGPSKTYKCRDVRKTVDLLMGMDLAALGDCMSGGAIKHGEFRKQLAAAGMDAAFDEHFETVEKWNIESGKDTPKLQKLDMAFLR